MYFNHTANLTLLQPAMCFCPWLQRMKSMLMLLQWSTEHITVFHLVGAYAVLGHAWVSDWVSLITVVGFNSFAASFSTMMRWCTTSAHTACYYFPPGGGGWCARWKLNGTPAAASTLLFTSPHPRACVSVYVWKRDGERFFFVTHCLTSNRSMKVVSFHSLHLVSFSIGGLLYRGSFHLLSYDAHAS